jgi:transcriptional regulator with XRE-family HTH domain
VFGFEEFRPGQEQLWEKMRAGGKPHRDQFVAAHLSTNIAAQIQTMREARGWSQKDLADKAGMAPARISVMEDPSYEGLTLTTLKRIASAFDVALITRFAQFSELVRWVSELSPGRLHAAPFDADQISCPAIERLEPPTLGGTIQSQSIQQSWQSNVAADEQRGRRTEQQKCSARL